MANFYQQPYWQHQQPAPYPYDPQQQHHPQQPSYQSFPAQQQHPLVHQQAYPQHHVQPVQQQPYRTPHAESQPYYSAYSASYSQPALNDPTPYQIQPPRPQSTFRRPLPVVAPKRADTVPPPPRNVPLVRTSTAAASLSRHSITLPSSSFPTSSFSTASVPTTQSAFPTRRPLPTPAPSVPSKHRSLDLSAWSVYNTDYGETSGQSRQIEDPTIKRATDHPADVQIRPSISISTSTKPILSSFPASQSSAGTKFVPIWKRASVSSPQTISPSSGGVPGGNKPLPLSPDGTVGVIPDLRGQLTPHARAPVQTSAFSNRTESPTKRELPQPPSAPATNGRAPVAPKPSADSEPESGSDSVTESDLESDSEPGSSRSGAQGAPSSPQYGILDLPRRNVQSMAEGGSMTLKFAALNLNKSVVETRNNTGAVQEAKSKPAAGSWTSVDFSRPDGATPFRGAQVAKRRVGYEDLNDSPPPPSLPRPSSSTSHQTGSRWTPGGQNRRQSPPRWQPSASTPPELQHPIPELPRSGFPSTLPKNAASEVVVPQIHIESPVPLGGRDTMADIPRLEFPDGGSEVPSINVQEPPTITVGDHTPTITISTDNPGPEISVSEPSGSNLDTNATQQRSLPPLPRRGAGLVCGGCGSTISGRMVNAMGVRWHPACFKCTICNELLEHVSSYEHDGKPYCHLDYHESFAPRCYTCKTAIIDERFITLDDPALGKRTYHEQHFFCAECGDPFLAPSRDPIPGSFGRTGELSVSGDGEFADDGVGFTVYKGHPYCESCHVRLRMPKCKKCKKSIRDGMQAVEALGGKWCWGCFVCEGCEKPFEEPSFYQREGLPFCEHCFTIILKSEL